MKCCCQANVLTDGGVCSILGIAQLLCCHGQTGDAAVPRGMDLFRQLLELCSDLGIIVLDRFTRYIFLLLFCRSRLRQKCFPCAVLFGIHKSIEFCLQILIDSLVMRKCFKTFACCRAQVIAAALEKFDCRRIVRADL